MKVRAFRRLLEAVYEMQDSVIAVYATGGMVGILDYLWPQPPKNAVECAVVGVGTGRNSRARWFTVFERLS